jgi:hypothetical protein
MTKAATADGPGLAEAEADAMLYAVLGTIADEGDTGNWGMRGGMVFVWMYLSDTTVFCCCLGYWRELGQTKPRPRPTAAKKGGRATAGNRDPERPASLRPSDEIKRKKERQYVHDIADLIEGCDRESER